METVKIQIGNDESYGSITNLYDLITEKMGYICNKMKYNPAKICCTKDIQGNIFQYYRDNGAKEEQLGFIWVSYGPKANLDGKNMVEIENGFFEF